MCVCWKLCHSLTALCFPNNISNNMLFALYIFIACVFALLCRLLLYFSVSSYMYLLTCTRVLVCVSWAVGLCPFGCVLGFVSWAVGLCPFGCVLGCVSWAVSLCPFGCVLGCVS